MPISALRMTRLLMASGLLMVVTFASARAQETPLDPNAPDILLPHDTGAGFHPVSQLATPENDYPNCRPAPQAWHPPVFYPDPTLYCPTGVVHRDWMREKTTGFFVARRQSMLMKDYQDRAENGCQPVCCPPHSCWGHSCDSCNGIGCKRSWSLFGGSKCQNCQPCGNGCNTNQGCLSHGDETSALDLAEGEFVLAGFLEESAEINDFDGIQLVSDEQFAGRDSGIEAAGHCTVSDHCPQSPVYYGSPMTSYGSWEECEFDGPDCDCVFCRLRHRCKMSRDQMRAYLYADGPYGDGFGGNGDGFRREGPRSGRYYIAYPVNPYHFDQRDGRIYAAQGYGHPVAVPLAPNVQHTYNYGWGLPSSRLTPVSRMPGAPGVANPAFPEAAGPGIFPPAYSEGMSLPQ